MVEYSERIVAKYRDGITDDGALPASCQFQCVVRSKSRLRMNCDIVLLMMSLVVVKCGRVAIPKRDDGTSNARTLGGCGDVDHRLVVSITTTIAARDT